MSFVFRTSPRAQAPLRLEDQSPGDDKDLTLAFQGGDDSAYRHIYDRHQARVSNICRRMLFDPADAEEATQETFLHVYKALGRFNGRYQLGAWIARIATNVCLDQIRAGGRRPDEVGGVELLENHEGPEVGDPEVLHLRESESHGVRKVLGELPPLHRAAIVLREYQGMSYAEMAIALDMSEPQVKALLHRARKGFKRSWKAPLAALLPSRFLNRFRSVEIAGRDEAAQVISSAGSSVASCTLALQQCGQYVAERAVFALSAVGLGVASTVAGSVVTSPPPSARPEVTSASLQASAPVSSRSKVLASFRAEPRPPQEPAATQSSTATEPPHVEASPPPQEEPPVPADGENEQPAPGPSPEPDPSPEPTEPPAPPPFTPRVGWEMGGAVPATTGSAQDLSLDCDASGLEQSFATTVWHGGEAIAGNVDLSIAENTGRWSMTLFTQGKDYTYVSWGASPRALWSAADNSGEVTVTLEGDYGPVYGSYPENAGLPQSGTFVAELTLDCARLSVITESLLLEVP